MMLRGVRFEDTFLPSGTLNFEMQGYPHHRFLKFIPGFGHKNATFVAKTTTLPERKGNMALDPTTLMPKKWFPDCIYVNLLNALMLNAVNLSGPGAEVLFERGEWFKLDKNFFISFMTVAETKEERLKEFQKFVELFKRFLHLFRVKVGLKVNITCPNTAHNLKDLEDETLQHLDMVYELGIPVAIKVNTMTNVRTTKKIMDSGCCDAIFLSNTIKFGQLSDRIDWEKLFGTKVSPLQKYGGGALSGWPVLPLVKEWIIKARDVGITKPIIGGNGISHRKHIDYLYPLVDGYSMGSVGAIRPWRWQNLINYANQKIKERNRR